MERRYYNPNDELTFAGMSQMVRAGNTIFFSGQCSVDEKGQLVGENDPLEQARQCFRNIEWMLSSEGATLADIVKLNCFVVNMDVYRAYAEVKRGLFIDNCPTGTCVMAQLLDPRFLLEVEAVVVLDGPK